MGAHTPVIDDVLQDDLTRIAQMMDADMRELGRSAGETALYALCEDAFRFSQERGGVLFIAAREIAGGPPIGMLLAHERLSVRFGGPSLWVEELYVDPEARMGGVGRALVTRALRKARARGLRGVDLEAYRMNTGASILYRSIGFERLARERYALDLDDLDWKE